MRRLIVENTPEAVSCCKTADGKVGFGALRSERSAALPAPDAVPSTVGSGETRLSLSGVTHIYPTGTRALDNVALEIPKGMFGLLGPNGAGKSTLMRCIATLQTPSQGSIRFGDIDVLAEPERLRAMLGYLPQDFG